MKNWKRRLPMVLAAVGMTLLAGVQGKAAVPVDEKIFPDASVRAFAESADANRDGVLSDEELGSVDYFPWYPRVDEAYGPAEGSITDFSGMEHFTNIRSVVLRGVGNDDETWNYADSNLFRYFPHVEYLNIDCMKKAKVSLTGSSARLKHLEFYNMGWNQDLVMENLDIQADNLEEIEISEMDLRQCAHSFEGLPALKKLSIADCLFPENGISLKGLSSLEYLKLLGSFKALDLTPAKKSLKKLNLTTCSDDPDFLEGEGNHALKSLDISQMEKLETVMAGDCGITSFITRDAAGKTKAKKIKDISLSGCDVKSIDVTGMPELQTLYLFSTEISRLDVTKNSKLTELGIGSPNIKKIDVTKNKKLDTLILYGAKLCSMKKLDLSRNTSLRSFEVRTGTYSKTTKIKRLKLPMPKKSLRWPSPSSMFNPYYQYGAEVLDLSAMTKLTAGTKKYQLTAKKKSGLKKVIINRKLKKADKNWIQKWAKKIGAKVAVK